MTTLTKASQQWATRPDDERFTSLPEMRAAANLVRENSQEALYSLNHLRLAPDKDNGLILEAKRNAKGAYQTLGAPTNWGFQQLSIYGKTQATTMREGRPAAMVADWVNYGFSEYGRDDRVKILTRQMHTGWTEGVEAPEDTSPEVAALTGPKYGRVWDMQVIDQCIERFGDGISGKWRQPGEFGKKVPITKANCTLYWSDRSMFIFLVNEDNRITVKNRRGGKPGSLARGFFLYNSETGKECLGFDTFLFDYVCSNRIVWGAQDVKSIKIRHSMTAPERFMEKVVPQLILYGESKASNDEKTVIAAQEKELEADEVDKLLRKLLPVKAVDKVQAQYIRDESETIHNLWGVITGVTAYAQTIPHTDVRLDLEAKAGKLLDLVAVR